MPSLQLLALRAMGWLVSRPVVANWIIRRAMRRPFTHIYKDGQLYMGRWWLFNPFPTLHSDGTNRWRFPFSVRVHYIRRADDDRHWHDHPWWCVGIPMRGGYLESRPCGGTLFSEVFNVYHAGDPNILAPGDYHKIEGVERGTMTLFIMGRYRGTWGFLVDGVKVPWREYRNAYTKEDNAN